MLEGAPGEVVAAGLDHQGESVLAWDAETGKPLSPIVVWQDKRSQSVLDRLADREREVKAASGLPFDPYFSAAKLAWLLEHSDDIARARDGGTLRMGTVDSFLCDRLGAGFATDPSTASRTQLQRIDAAGFDPALCEIFGVPLDVLPEIRDTAGELGTLSHPSWPVELPLCGQTVDQQAALAGSGCVVPGRVKATYGTGVFVLAHAGEEVPEPAGGLLPTIAWRIDGTPRIRARRRRLRGWRDAGVDVPGAGPGRRPGRPGRARARSRDLRQRPGAAGARRHRRPLVAAERPGRPRRAPRRHQRAMVARAALEGITWRVADVVAAIRETVEVASLRVDGGLTNEPLVLQLQADAIGVPVEAAGADATVLGAAALAAVGAGVFDSLAEAAELLPVDRTRRAGA